MTRSFAHISGEAPLNEKENKLTAERFHLPGEEVYVSVESYPDEPLKERHKLKCQRAWAANNRRPPCSLEEEHRAPSRRTEKPQDARTPKPSKPSSTKDPQIRSKVQQGEDRPTALQPEQRSDQFPAAEKGQRQKCGGFTRIGWGKANKQLLPRWVCSSSLNQENGSGDIWSPTSGRQVATVTVPEAVGSTRPEPAPPRPLTFTPPQSETACGSGRPRPPRCSRCLQSLFPCSPHPLLCSLSPSDPWSSCPWLFFWPSEFYGLSRFFG